MAVYTVDVTQEDIDKAFRNNSARCVVAQAIARTFPKATRINVDMHSIRFTDGPRRLTYLTPVKVAQYVVAFDAGDTIHPFRFQLRTDQRLVMARQQRTDAGKRVDRAARKVTDTRRAAEKVEADPTATEAVRTVAREKVAAAEANERVVRAEVAAEPKTVTERPEAPPAEVKPYRSGRQTVFGKNERHYGHRTLRDNQDTGPGDFRGPLDVD